VTSHHRDACSTCGAPIRAPQVRGEGTWNQGWRKGIPPERQFIRQGGKEADVQALCGIFIELQYGSLGSDSICCRERAHGRLAWLFHAVEAHAGLRLRLQIRPGRNLVNFHWQRPRKSILSCEREVYLDLGPSDQANGLHVVMKAIRPREAADGRILGAGLLYTADDFRSWMIHDTPLTPWHTPEPTPHTTVPRQRICAAVL
jgi:hypothetical protein